MGKSASERAAVGVRTMIALAVLHNEQVASVVGMSASEMQAVHLLQLRGPMTPGELATATRLSTGTVTGVVDRLEALGFAHRGPHPTDRRKVVVTPDNEAIWQAFGSHYARHAEHMDDVIGRFSTAQLAVVADFLDALADDP